MKFLNHEAFLATVTQWVRDGSSYEAAVSANWGEQIILRGKDGATEVLTCYFEQEDFDNDDSISGDPKPEPEKSPYEQALEALADSYVASVKNFVMQNPGVLATYGPDFVTELGDLTVYTERDLTGPSTLDTVEILVEQKIRFSTAEYYNRQRALKDLSLRQTPEGNLESV